ncbi:endonuclease/exonuclease/phosphatase family protein [Nocardioides marmoraquaticus]
MTNQLVRRLATALCALAVLAVLALHAVPSSGAAAPTQLRVGSFNISGVHGDSSASGDRKVWRERRGRVVNQIISRKLAVVGLQEANPSATYASRLVDRSTTTQYDDLVSGLNAAGGNYAVTTAAPYNCARAASSYRCDYRDQGSALSNRIIFDRGLLSVVSKGSMKYAAQTAGKYDRYLEWAVFSVRATGKRFLFTNTHLDPYSVANREAQWREALVKTSQLRGSMPVISVGDYNSHKFSPWAERMLPMTKQYGITDALNQGFRQNPSRAPRAEKVVNAWLGSFNGYKRDMRGWSYEDNKSKQGNHIDWVFASDGLRILDYEVVAWFDAKSLRVKSVFPSDHNLVRATVVLPAS